MIASCGKTRHLHPTLQIIADPFRKHHLPPNMAMESLNIQSGNIENAFPNQGDSCPKGKKIPVLTAASEDSAGIRFRGFPSLAFMAQFTVIP